MSKDYDRYLAAAHAMQSGVQMEISLKGEKEAAANPKHLRTGVNVAMCDHAALVRLLVEKGVISDAEYHKAIADEMEREVERYKKTLGLGDNVTP